MAGVPSNMNLPFVGASFNKSGMISGLSDFDPKGLLLGQKTSNGEGAVGVVHSISSPDDVARLAGYDSHLYRDAVAYQLNNQSIPLYMVLADDPTGTASVSTVTGTGTATSAGELALYLNYASDLGRYAVSVAVGDVIADVFTAMETAINGDIYNGYTATTGSGTLILTRDNVGEGVGDTDLRFNANTGESTPAGLTVSSAVVAGTGQVDSSDFTDAIGTDWFQVISGPYNDATFLTGIQTWLDTNSDAIIMKDAVYHTGLRGDKTALLAFSATSGRNSKRVVCTDCDAILDTISMRAARKAAATIQSVVNEDVAVPFHRMTMVGAVARATEDIRSITDRNELAGKGIATFLDENGVQTEATVTMSYKNDAGGLDDSDSQENTAWQLMYLRYTFVQLVNKIYGRAKLVDSTEKITSNAVTISPRKGKDLAIAWFKQLESKGIVENFDQFKDQVQCYRNTDNVNRLEWFLPTDLANQFIVGSAEIGYIN